MDASQILEGIKAHPYATIIIASIVNGRFTAPVVGACIVQGSFNPCIAYVIFVIMDVLGDTLYYFIGRLGYLGLRFFIRGRLRKKVEEFNASSENAILKALVLTKITLGSKPVIVAAGIAKVPLYKFYSIAIPCTLVMFILYMVGGYYFAHLVPRD